jgi:hypothetical protein
MSRGRVLHWVAAHLPGIDEPVRADLVDTIDRTASHASTGDRLADAVSLVGFALQSSSRRGTGDRRTPMLRQGARVAALPIAAGFTALAWSLGALVAALAGAAVLVLVGAGLRWAAAGPALLAVVATTGSSPQLLVLSGVVLVVVVVGEPFDRTACPTGGLVAGLGVAVGAGAGSVWSPTSVLSVVDIGVLGVLAVFLVIGWSDPRFAVAATILCASRFVTADVAELTSALGAAVTRDEVRVVLARWAIMGAGVAASWLLTRAALDRCLTAHQ